MKNHAGVHCNTIFSQMLKLMPTHGFEALAKQHHSSRSLRTASCWSQVMTLTMAQLSGRSKLRGILENASMQAHRHYHLDSAKIPDSNLSRINDDKPHGLYEALFGKLLNRCQGVAPGQIFRFKNSLYSLGASTIDLCLSIFSRADFRTTTGAVKLHVGLIHEGFLSEFVAINKAKTSDITAGCALNPPKGSIVTFDRGFNASGCEVI